MQHVSCPKLITHGRKDEENLYRVFLIHETILGVFSRSSLKICQFVPFAVDYDSQSVLRALFMTRLFVAGL
jgi:hypothetical protein